MESGFAGISHISAYAAHQGGLVLRYGLGKSVITPKIGNWSVFVFVGMAFDIRDNHETRCARAPRLRRHHGSGGINKAASLHLLRL